MVSHVDVVDLVEFPEMSPVARGSGRRGRIGQGLVEDMGIRVFLYRELDIMHISVVATKISIDFPGCVHVNLGSYQTPSLRHVSFGSRHYSLPNCHTRYQVLVAPWGWL